jgi:hypothetical protein
MQKPPKAKLPNQMADLGGQIVMINFKKLSLKALDRQQTPSPEPPTDKLLQRLLASIPLDRTHHHWVPLS